MSKKISLNERLKSINWIMMEYLYRRIDSRSFYNIERNKSKNLSCRFLQIWIFMI